MYYKEKIIALRERMGLNQKEIAQIIGISNARYCFYENEIEIIPLKHLETICNYFNVSFDYIFGFNNIKQYENSILNIDIIKSGNRLKEIRKELKLTQSDLSNILKSGRTTITSYEKGIYLIATPFLYTICKKYNISADYLLGKIDSPKYLK